MTKFELGDIVVTRSSRGQSILNSKGERVFVYPWVIGKIIFVHPENGFCTYSNGRFNESAWNNELMLYEDWVKIEHSPDIPVKNFGII